jgi:1,4-dihydroxy-2-naphthoate polyprenyltransferase
VERPGAEPTGWAWRLLEDEFASRVGSPGWAAFVAGALASCPAASDEAFARVVRRLEERLGDGSGAIEHEAGRRLAESWGDYYEPLVEDLRGHPQRLLALFAGTVYPSLVHGSGPARVLRSTQDEALLRFEDALPDGFRRGLVEGFVRLCGARTSSRATGDGQVTIAWRLEPERPRVRAWAMAASAVRFPFLVATVVPVFVALAIAARAGPLDVAGALLTLLGVLCFQFGSNALNDFYDRRTGDARGLASVAQGAPARWLRTTAVAYYAAGTIVGLLLVARSGIEVLWLGLAGFLLGVLYTAPPVRLAHRGLGELAVAVGFGPLIVLGTYFVQRHGWSLQALLASVPLAFLIALVLYLHELPDRAGDARLGKRTLIVRLPERPAVVVYVLLQALTYLLILGGVALASVPRLAAYAFPAWSLLGLLTLPLAARASLLLARNYRYPYRLVPTNAAAVRLHLLTGVLFAAGYAIPLLA